MSSVSVFSDTLTVSHLIKVLERSLQKRRLPHSILLHGVNLDALERVALDLAEAWLHSPGKVAHHPDLFILRPSHKARQIQIGRLRDLIRCIQHSPYQSNRKVALIYEANRMNNAAANAFLKTLEEPPSNTTILLLSTRPYELLDTIRSRCFNFRLPTTFNYFQDADWETWLHDYKIWLEELTRGLTKKGQKGEMIFILYGLIMRFQVLLKKFSSMAWEKEKQTLSEALSDEEIEACEVGLRKSIQQRLFTEIELHTRHFALTTKGPRSQLPTQQLCRAIDTLEQMVGLLKVNLHENVALECFLLASLRNWTNS